MTDTLSSNSRQANTTTMNIKEYFEEQQQKYNESFSTWKQTKADHESELKQKAGELTAYQELREHEEKFIKEAKDKGLDPAPCVQRIKALDAEIENSESAHACLRAELEKLSPPQERNFNVAFEFADILAEHHHCTAAKRIHSMKECYASLPINLQPDDVGRPKKLIVDLGWDERHEVAIKTDGSRFVNAFRPRVLDWLPQSESPDPECQTNNNHGRSKFLAFVNESSNRLLVTTTTLCWRQKLVHGYKGFIYGSPNDAQYRDMEREFPGFADSLSAHVHACLKEAGDVIDTGMTYDNNPLAAEFRSRVLSLTTTVAQFKPTEVALTSQAIHETIKCDWDAFIKCPWAESVTGTLALLKYYAESGERPRFWSGQFEGHYGFRLRTRDHTWIKGQVFIESTLSPAASDSQMHVRGASYGVRVVASLGRMHLLIESYEKG